MPVAIPLADVADAWLGDLARATCSADIAKLRGETLLGERAMLNGFTIPRRTSAGGGCRLHDARGGVVALNLARPDDWALLPALFETDDAVVAHADVAPRIATSDAEHLVARGRVLGLAIATEGEAPPLPDTIVTRAHPIHHPPRPPRVLDLTALWAGPLAAHLLWHAGAEVTRVESASRPDRVRVGGDRHFAVLNQGKVPAALDLRDARGRVALLDLVARSDIVIEAARPRALEQLGIHADAILRAQPGLSWVTITGHGVTGDAAHWVGFGDDCGVAGGLSAALRRATGQAGFVGDAIADPLTGIHAARAAWNAWTAGGGVRVAIAMSGVVSAAIAAADARSLDDTLVAWAAGADGPFPTVARREIDGPPC